MNQTQKWLVLNQEPVWCRGAAVNAFIQSLLREAFKKKTTEHMEISICWGEGGSGGGPFPYVFTIVPKCILSHFKHF